MQSSLSHVADLSILPSPFSLFIMLTIYVTVLTCESVNCNHNDMLFNLYVNCNHSDMYFNVHASYNHNDMYFNMYIN